MPCPSPARASAPGTSGAVPEAGQGLRTGGSPAAAPSTPPPDLARDALQPGYSRVPAEVGAGVGGAGEGRGGEGWGAELGEAAWETMRQRCRQAES